MSERDEMLEQLRIEVVNKLRENALSMSRVVDELEAAKYMRDVPHYIAIASAYYHAANIAETAIKRLEK